MMEKKLFFLLISFWLEIQAYASVIPNSEDANRESYIEKTSCDSIELPILTEIFYEDVSFLNKKYEYEKINQINSLNMWSRDVFTFGIAVASGLGAVSIGVMTHANWSEWISIPCSMIFATAVGIPFYIWSNHLKKKAELLSSQTVYLYNINRYLDIGAASFTNSQNHSLQAVGIGLKVKF